MRKLIYKDNSAKITFSKEVETVRNKVNSLITSFNEAQDFAIISTKQEFESLIQNPVEYFDTILIQNCEIKSKTGRIPEPSVLANLFGIKRDDYLEKIGWEVVKESNCEGCTKAQPKLIHQKEIITAEKYSKYAAYLLFDNRFFKFNEPAIEEKLKEFDIYTSTPGQLAIYKFWEDACTTLNSLNEKGYLGNEALINLQKALNNRLMFSYATGKLHLEEKILMNEILKTK